MKYFRCDFRHRPMGVDPPLATPMPYSLCSTSHSILQWHCFLDTRIHLKNSRWFRDRVAFLLHEDRALLLIFFRRFAYHSQHPQGSWYFRCLVFPRQYRAVVHWIRGPSSTLSKTYQITLLSLFFKLSLCKRFTYTLLLVWDVARHGISTPFLKNMFFFSDTRFVIRAIYLPSLFQPLPRW